MTAQQWKCAACGAGALTVDEPFLAGPACTALAPHCGDHGAMAPVDQLCDDTAAADEPAATTDGGSAGDQPKKRKR